jgi:hypothetical protein
MWVWVLPVLYSLTAFVSAALLFQVEPITARLVLPLLGGTPAVWNTCMVFFQAVLLAGYAYAHFAPGWLPIRWAAVVHLAVLLLPFLVLPIHLPETWGLPGSTFPAAWLLGVLVTTVGLPFFALATSAPLLQRWFAASDHPSARDPYFLYAASNGGSLIALLAYPLALEPTLGLAEQAWWWSAGYGVFVLLVLVCLAARLRVPSSAGAVSAAVSPRILWPRRLHWLLLAFVPSSLLLSVTTWLSTDVAAIPLFWVVPLAIYLLTFIFAFSPRAPLSPTWTARWLPLVALMLVFTLLSEATEPPALLMVLHLGGLFWISLFCHGSLAADRPPADRLGEYYLWLAGGGVLGGLFNALLAPLLFPTVAEYPLLIVLACALRPNLEPATESRSRVLDLVLPIGLGLLTTAAILVSQAAGVSAGPVSTALMFGAPVVVCYTFLGRSIRFALGLAVLLLAGGLYGGVFGTTIYRDRSFFGVHRVTHDPTGAFRQLVHGNTIHGRQSLDPSLRREPMVYYSRSGPAGQLFATIDRSGRFRRVGVVGLGAGALSCYARPGQHWTYYEIDPVVVHIARDSGLFTYLADSRAPVEVVLGDARLTLAASSERFDLLIIDAFSSDAVPAHLLTREALAIYQARLAPNGVLAFNISNRYLDLRPVLGNLAADASPPLQCLDGDDTGIPAMAGSGKAPSHWVVLTGCPTTALLLRQTGAWRRIRPQPGGRVWSDDFTNILGALKWWSSFD